VRHLLNRWGLAYYFCSANALHHIFVVTQSAAAYILFFAYTEKTLEKNKIPSAAPQTVWRRGGAFRTEAVCVIIISVGVRKI
jgi:hypothetical protein